MRETILKNFKKDTLLAEGRFSEGDFDKNFGSGGRMQMGEMSPQRKELIKSDAKRRLDKLIKKFPWLIEGEKKEEVKEEKKEEVNVLEKLKKSKKKKSKKS
jgi:hypothetical protein